MMRFPARLAACRVSTRTRGTRRSVAANRARTTAPEEAGALRRGSRYPQYLPPNADTAQYSKAQANAHSTEASMGHTACVGAAKVNSHPTPCKTRRQAAEGAMRQGYGSNSGMEVGLH